MNLIIDVGNTFIKLAVFSGKTLLIKDAVKRRNAKRSFDTIYKNYPKLEQAIVSSVGKKNEKLVGHISQHMKVMVLSKDIKLPFKNKYETPNTLGVDRIALVCASVDQFPENNALIIDAGTCITFDFVNKKNEYLGGAISPGITLRYQSLHNFTANLPLLETKYPESIVGNSTSESIHSGVINGILNEIDGVIDIYEEKYQDLTVILTGGDADFLSKRLKNSIFANSNFLLEGLNFVLEHNSHR